MLMLLWLMRWLLLIDAWLMLIVFLMLSITWGRGFDGVVIGIGRMVVVFVFIGFD
jgi:hypothetical protein